MAAQKRVLCIQDLSCLGRCSLAVALPVLSACGHTVTPLPTVLLSTHTGGFGTPARVEQGAFCTQALAHYRTLDMPFDSVYSGYLADESQAELVRQAFALAPGALKLVDPVLGDGGKPYRFVTPALAQAMAGLCAEADWITPNVTESALLLGLAPDAGPLSAEQARARAGALRSAYGAGVVLTGVQLDTGGRANVLAPCEGGAPRLLAYALAPGSWPGTGDLFASALLGLLLCRRSATDAVARAARFVAACAAAAGQDGLPARYGVPFERFLAYLANGDDPFWQPL